MPMPTRLLNQCLTLLLLAACAYAQEAQNQTSGYQPSPQNLEARRWFQESLASCGSNLPVFKMRPRNSKLKIELCWKHLNHHLVQFGV